MKLPRAHHLTYPELAGQLLLLPLKAGFVNRQAPELLRQFQQTEHLQPAGFLVQGEHPVDVRLRMEQIQQHVRFPLLFLAHPRQGLSPALPQATLFPHFLAWGMTGDSDLISQAARALAREARAVGLNGLLFPSLHRALASPSETELQHWYPDDEMLSTLLAAAIGPVLKEGLTCFPYLNPLSGTFLSPGKWHTEPFSQLPGVFLTIPPVSLQQFEFLQILEFTRKLREDHHFGGLIIVEGEFLTSSTQQEEMLTSALRNGLGPFVVGKEPEKFHAFLKEILEKDEPARREAFCIVDALFRLKKDLHRHQPEFPHFKRIYKIWQLPRHQELAEEIARRSAVKLHGKPGIRIPNTGTGSIHFLPITDLHLSEPPLSTFQKLLEKEAGAQTVSLEQFTEVGDLPFPAPQLLIASLHSSFFARKESSAETISRIFGAYQKAGTQLILCVFGRPFLLKRLPHWQNAEAVYLFPTDVPAAQRVAFRILRGETQVEGKLPAEWEKEIIAP